MEESKVGLAVKSALMPDADFFDCYTQSVREPARDAIELVNRIFDKTPDWIGRLFTLRNKLVAPLGLKPAPVRGATPGSFVFPILSVAPDRVVMGLDDKHLDFRLAFDVASRSGSQTISVTTLARTHNLGGRAYLACVLPFHRVIAPRMLAMAINRNALIASQR